MTLGELKEPTEGERVAQKMREKWYNVPVNLRGETDLATGESNGGQIRFDSVALLAQERNGR